MLPTTAVIVDVETRADTDLMTRLGYHPKDGGFNPLIYHIPCAMAIGCLTGEGVLTSVESLGDGLLADDPCELTTTFWQVVSQSPMLISFNGRGFDIPVMELCALRYGCGAPKHWGAGRDNTRYRYGQAHTDLLDILSNYGGATKGLTLSNLMAMLGYAGKEGMDGSHVQAMWERG